MVKLLLPLLLLFALASHTTAQTLAKCGDHSNCLETASKFALFSVNATSSTGVASTPASQANNTIVFITIACVFGGLIFCCCFLYILPRVYYCCCLKRKVEKAQAKLAREIEQAQLESIKTQGEAPPDWWCPVCTLVNKGHALSCAACNTPKPNLNEPLPSPVNHDQQHQQPQQISGEPDLAAAPIPEETHYVPAQAPADSVKAWDEFQATPAAFGEQQQQQQFQQPPQYRVSASVQPAGQQQPDFLAVSPLPASQITHTKRTEGKRGQTAALQDFFSARPEPQPQPEPQAPQLSLAEIAELRAQQYARLSVAAPTPFHAIPDDPAHAHAHAKVADDGLLSDVVAAQPQPQAQPKAAESKYRPEPIAPLHAQAEPASFSQPVVDLAPAASPAVFAPVAVSVSASAPAAPLAAMPVAVVSPQPASDAAPIPVPAQPLLPPPAQEDADWFCPQCSFLNHPSLAASDTCIQCGYHRLEVVAG